MRSFLIPELSRFSMYLRKGNHAPFSRETARREPQPPGRLPLTMLSWCRGEPHLLRNRQCTHRRHSGRMTGLHVSQLSREKQEFSGRALESALLVRSGSAATHVCLSAEGCCILAEPDIHLLPQAPKSRRRRLSLCSLPVPKQFEESLGSCLLRPAGHLRDLAVCALEWS
jgi:hypothetical protein